MLTPRTPLDSHPKRMLEMLLFAMLSFGVTLWISSRIFSNKLLYPEEGSALFQAGNFLDATHSRNPRGYADLIGYETMTIVPHQDWKSRFAPGHPFWLVPGVWVGWPQLMTSLSAMITMMALYGIGWRLRIPRFLLPLLLLFSPFFLFLHGTLLPQTSGMLFCTLFLLGYLKWRQDRNLLWAFLSGFCWSLLLQIRPMTAAFVFIPFCVDLLLEWKRNRRTALSWVGSLLFVLACLVGGWAFLRYNKVSTGDPFLVSYLEHEPSETWGFGERRTQGGGVEVISHTVKRGWILLWQNLRSLDRWLLGTFPGTLAVLFGLLVHGWSRRWSGLIFGSIVCVLFGYMAFWDDGASMVGPLNYADLLPFFLIVGGLGLSRIWRRMQAKPRRRALLFAVAGALLLSRTLPFIFHTASDLRHQNERAWQIEGAVSALPEASLVFLPESIGRDETLKANLALNAKGWESPVLRLQAKPEDRAALAESFPDRNVYELLLDPVLHLKPVELKWMPPTRKAVNSQHSRGTGKNVEEERVAQEKVDEPGLLFYGWYSYLPPGDYECRFDIRWSEVSASAPLRLEVMADLGTVSLGEQILAEGLDDTVIRFRLSEARQVEPRVYFGGTGKVTLRSISLSQLPAQPLP